MSEKRQETEQPVNTKIIEGRLTKMEPILDTLNKNDGILIRQPKDKWGEISLSIEKQMANQVLNALEKTLIDTTRLCLSKKESELPYEETAEVLSLLLLSLNDIGLGKLKFKQNSDIENSLKKKYQESEIYCFETGPIKVDGVSVDKLRIMIRPEDHLVDKFGQVRQVAQARTKISIFSPNIPTGEASIRIDPPDPRLANNIIFDLAIGGELKETVIDSLELDQSAGHHFQSGVNISDFGPVSVANVHRAIVNRLMQLS